MTHRADPLTETYRVSAKRLRESGRFGPEIALFGAKLWANQRLRRGMTVTESVDFETGDYIYTAGLR